MASFPSSAVHKAGARVQAAPSSQLTVNPLAPTTASSESQPPAPRNAFASSQSNHLTSHEDGTDDENNDEQGSDAEVEAIFEDDKPKRVASSAKLSPPVKIKPSSKHSTPKVEVARTKAKVKAKLEQMDEDDEIALAPVQTKAKRKAPAMTAPDAKKAKANDDLALQASLQAAQVSKESATALGQAIKELLLSLTAASKSANEAQAQMWANMLADHRKSMETISQSLAQQCRTTVEEISSTRTDSIKKIREFYNKAMNNLQSQVAEE